jgi:hypothetical protein
MSDEGVWAIASFLGHVHLLPSSLQREWEDHTGR